MLTTVPKRWFSWNFTVMEGARVVADIDVSCWRESGVLTVDGDAYRAYRERAASGAFVLASHGSVLARAVKPSAFRRSFVIEHSGKAFQLVARSAFSRTFLLLDGEREIGSLSPEGLFTRRARVDLPTTWLLPVRVFVIWIAVIMWKRESDASVVAATS